MTWFSIFVTSVTLCTVLLAIYNHWNLSNANLKKVYPFVILNCTLYIIVETAIAIRDPEQIGLILSDITNLWAIIMAVRGWAKLKEKEKESNK